MNIRLSYRKIITLGIYVLSSATSLMAMEFKEPINLETSEWLDISLEEPLIPAKSYTLIEQNKDKLNRQLSQKAWRIIFDLFAINQLAEFDPTTDVDLSSEATNPFLKHNPENDNAKQLIVLLTKVIPKESPTVEKVLQAFILFTKGKSLKSTKIIPIPLPIINAGIPVQKDVTPEFLDKLDDTLKTLLDKYRYLHFNKHFKLQEHLLGYVSITELINFNKIADKIRERSVKLGSDEHNIEYESQITVTEQEIRLENAYLESLKGWENLAKHNYIIPQLVCVIDLSRNNLTEVPAELLKGFVNLEKLLMAHNKLTNLPAQLFTHSPKLETIDVTHNEIATLPDEITSNAHIMYALILDYNPLTENAKKALIATYPGILIKPAKPKQLKKSIDEIGKEETYNVMRMIGIIAVAYTMFEAFR